MKNIDKKHYVRANGHSRETVAETIRTCAPTIRENPKGRDWQHYAERTADYAFGMAGDQDMARNQRFWPLWRKVEGLEEEQREQEGRALEHFSIENIHNF